MDIRNQIWYDLVHSRCGDYYLILYLNRQKSYRKWFKIMTIVLSAGGALGWKIWEPIAWIACAIIAVVQLLSSIESHLIHTEKQIEELQQLRLLYYDRSNKLHELWYNFDNDHIDEKTAKDNFFELRSLSNKIEDLDNKLNVKRVKNLYILADNSTRNYLKQYFNHE